ncbi:MAG: SMR family transporter [Acetobacter sp.]|uniref:DMT family transporter n=1 Tax=Acetobacter sp. TaxID=440 RepID=UPI0039EBE367
MLGYLCIVITVLSEVTATVAMREADNFTKALPISLMVAGYISSFLFLSLALRLLPMGIVYAGSAGLGTICASLVGWIRFHEPINSPYFIGIFFIISGLFIICYARTIQG